MTKFFFPSNLIPNWQISTWPQILVLWSDCYNCPWTAALARTAALALNMLQLLKKTKVGDVDKRSLTKLFPELNLTNHNQNAGQILQGPRTNKILFWTQ